MKSTYLYILKVYDEAFKYYKMGVCLRLVMDSVCDYDHSYPE